MCAFLGAFAVAGLWITTPRDLDPVEGEAIARYRHVQNLLLAERSHRVDEATLQELTATDIEETGLVGIAWSPTTTTPGELAAKQLAARAGWVAVFRGWYRDAGLRPGDAVAINTSGSFPGLFLAARIAAESMHLRARAVASLTSSNYGANVPGFDLMTMDDVMTHGAGLAPIVVGVTPGGDGDAARGMEDADREALRARLRVLAAGSAKVGALWPATLDESASFRRRLLLDADPPPRLFVSIGGHVTALGVGDSALILPPGMIRPGDVAASRAGGLAREALDRGVPVVKVLGLRELDAALGVAQHAEGVAQPAAPWRRVVAMLVVVALSVLVWSNRRIILIGETAA